MLWNEAELAPGGLSGDAGQSWRKGDTRVKDPLGMAQLGVS